VEHKIPKSALSTKDQLPSEVEGLPTDVIATGSSGSEHASDIKRGTDPSALAPQSVQDSPSNDNFVMAGTFGAVVSKSGNRFILSNTITGENGVVALGPPSSSPACSTVAMKRLTRWLPSQHSSKLSQPALTKSIVQ